MSRHILAVAPITLRTDHCLNILGRISGYRASLAGNGGHRAEASFHAIVEELVAKELTVTGSGRRCWLRRSSERSARGSPADWYRGD